MARFEDLTGQKFNMLTVVRKSDSRNKRGLMQWVCRCNCGRYTEIITSSLRGSQKSCGCLKRGIETGRSKTPEYRHWQAMKNRCQFGPTYLKWGIKVDPIFENSFEAFLEDVGEKPDPTYTLDRIDTHKNYEQGNIRWVPAEHQSRNRTMSSNNKSGHTGVHKTTVKKRDKYVSYWVGTWRDPAEGIKYKRFNIATYGEEVAKQKAIEYRAEMYQKLLDRDIGYTEVHGTAHEQ